MIDELAHAGPEHLDPAFVAGYDRKQGYPDPADRRSFRLPLTEAGQAVADRVLAAVADLEREALGRLSATQLAGYHAVITALQEAC